MGVITNTDNTFISADLIYSKIKNEFKTFASVNLLDDIDFPTYTMEVLRILGNAALRETEAVILFKNHQAPLPKDFQQLYAAYRCDYVDTTKPTTNQLLQNKVVFETQYVDDILCPQTRCEIKHHLENNDVVSRRITVKQYVNEVVNTQEFTNLQLLRLTPNVRVKPNKINASYSDEITINNGFIFSNCSCDAIYLQYYAYPFDENGLPLIPNNARIEKVVENYIKWQLLLNFWITDSAPNIMQKAQYYQMEYDKALAEAKHYNKLPSFTTMVNFLRNLRSINKLAFFSQASVK